MGGAHVPYVMSCISNVEMGDVESGLAASGLVRLSREGEGRLRDKLDRYRGQQQARDPR